MARGDWGMRSENHFARNSRHGFIEADAFFVLHAVSNRFFEHRETAVAFVEAQHSGRDSHGFQSAEAAHSKQQFLADSDSRISRRKDVT